MWPRRWPRYPLSHRFEFSICLGSACKASWHAVPVYLWDRVGSFPFIFTPLAEPACCSLWYRCLGCAASQQQQPQQQQQQQHYALPRPPRARHATAAWQRESRSEPALFRFKYAATKVPSNTRRYLCYLKLQISKGARRQNSLSTHRTPHRALGFPASHPPPAYQRRLSHTLPPRASHVCRLTQC